MMQLRFYTRCCSPWQSLYEDKCLMTKTRMKTNLSINLMTSMPDCKAIRLGEEEGLYRLGGGGALELTGQVGRRVEWERYCLDRSSARVCHMDR